MALDAPSQFAAGQPGERDALRGERRDTLEHATVSASDQVVAVIDEAALTRVTSLLRRLCAELDREAEELIDRESALLGIAYPGHFQAISRAIRNFDFDGAMAQLNAAIAARRT